VIPALLLTAALSSPAPLMRHELTGTVGLGGPDLQRILVVSWTGRRRWGAWFRVDQRGGHSGRTSVIPNTTQRQTSAGSIGVAWRPLPRLTVGLGYGHFNEDSIVYGSVEGPDGPVAITLGEQRDHQHGLAAIGTWTFPVNETLGVALSATAGPGGFGGSAGVNFYF